MTAATLSDIYSSITSAIGALKGPLHGGANQDVIKILLDAGTPEGAVAKVKEMLAQKEENSRFRAPCLPNGRSPSHAPAGVV